MTKKRPHGETTGYALAGRANKAYRIAHALEKTFGEGRPAHEAAVNAEDESPTWDIAADLARVNKPSKLTIAMVRSILAERMQEADDPFVGL